MKMQVRVINKICSKRLKRLSDKGFGAYIRFTNIQRCIIVIKYTRMCLRMILKKRIFVQVIGESINR